MQSVLGVSSHVVYVDGGLDENLRIIEGRTVNSFLFLKNVFTGFPLCILSWIEGVDRREVGNRITFKYDH